jgi:hypothetical protein
LGKSKVVVLIFSTIACPCLFGSQENAQEKLVEKNSEIS